MSGSGLFLDSSVLLYLRSADAGKADSAESLLRLRPVISVQVLNEFANVSRRKLRRERPEIIDALKHIKAICPVVPVTLSMHERGLDLAATQGFSVYDAMIVAAAEGSDCGTVISEDMQHGRQICSLTIRHPFQ